MSVLSELAAFLTSSGCGTIYQHNLPATPATAAAIYLYGGSEPDGGFGSAGVVYEHPSVQVVFRGEPNDMASPMTLARTAYAALAAIQPGTLSGTPYLRVWPVQQPFVMTRDESNRYVVACNYRVDKEPS